MSKSDSEDVKQTMDHLNLLCSQKETQIQNLTKEKQELSESRRSLAERLRTAYDEADATWKKLDECVQQRSNLEKQNESYKSRLEKLESELNMERKERKKIEDIISLVRKKEKDRENEMSEERKRLESLKADLSKKMEELLEKETDFKKRLLNKDEGLLKRDIEDSVVLQEYKRKLVEAERSSFQLKDDLLKEKQKNNFISEALKFLVEKFDLLGMRKIFFDENLFQLSLSDYESFKANRSQDPHSFFDTYFFKTAAMAEKERDENGIVQNAFPKSFRSVSMTQNMIKPPSSLRRQSSVDSSVNRKKFTSVSFADEDQGSSSHFIPRAHEPKAFPPLRGLSMASRTMSGNVFSGMKLENIENIDAMVNSSNTEASASSSRALGENTGALKGGYALKEVRNERGNVIARISTRNRPPFQRTIPKFGAATLDASSLSHIHTGIYQ